MAITNEQLILLDNLIYLDNSVIQNDVADFKVASVVNHLLNMNDSDFKTAVTDEQFFYCGDMVNGMTTNQWKFAARRGKICSSGIFRCAF